MAAITLTIRGVEFDVIFDFQPAESEVRYGYNGGYPGCAASIDDIRIYHNEEDFTEFFSGEMKMIEDEIWNYYKKEPR